MTPGGIIIPRHQMQRPSGELNGCRHALHDPVKRSGGKFLRRFENRFPLPRARPTGHNTGNGFHSLSSFPLFAEARGQQYSDFQAGNTVADTILLNGLLPRERSANRCAQQAKAIMRGYSPWSPVAYRVLHQAIPSGRSITGTFSAPAPWWLHDRFSIHGAMVCTFKCRRNPPSL